MAVFRPRHTLPPVARPGQVLSWRDDVPASDRLIVAPLTHEACLHLVYTVTKVKIKIAFEVCRFGIHGANGDR
jgi:hypothetical protein